MSDLKYYKILELNKDATIEEIKKNFRRLAKDLHPDKGGDPEKFKELNEAYSVLSDPEKKEIYDEYGEEGLQSSGKGPSPADIKEMVRRNNHKKVMCDITLEELFMGAKKNIIYDRITLCKNCKTIKCKECNGMGMVAAKINRGPFTQIINMECRKCEGKKVESDNNDCTICKGQKTINENITKEIDVEPGHDIEDYIMLEKEGDEINENTRADIVVFLKLLPHKFFTVNKKDIIIEIKIPLFDALCGFEKDIVYLDGKSMIIKSTGIISHKTKKIYKNLGLKKKHKLKKSRGNLIVKFDIEYPEKLTKEQSDILKKLFINNKKYKMKYDEEEIHILNIDTAKDFEENSNNENDNERQECHVQ